MSVNTGFRKLIDAEKGVIDRSIFGDKQVYQLELEQVFGRCWLFIGHESQVLKPNDFIANYMGEDPVLLTRDAKGKLHTFLNMCRHRGNRICRADEGNAPSFMCTYHGWTFATDGKLVGVPGYKEAYFEELDRSQWGLVEAAHTASYKGLTFATWDGGAPSLKDYLGDMVWYLDTQLDNRDGGTEFVKGVSKQVLPCNWKFPCDNNGGDSYHSAITHFSSSRVLAEARDNSTFTPRLANGSTRPVYAGNGHATTGGGFLLGRRASSEKPTNLLDAYRLDHLPERVQRLGEFRALTLGYGGPMTVFPNFSYTGGSFKVYHPRGPFSCEEWCYMWTDRDAPIEVKDATRRQYTISHGPSGMREEEDGLNWMGCTTASKSITGLKYVQNIQLGIGHEGRDERFPGLATKGPNEVNQRHFYKRWAEIMDAPSWNDIPIDPITYDKLTS